MNYEIVENQVIFVEDTKVGGYTVWFKDLPNIPAEGDSKEDALHNLVISLYDIVMDSLNNRITKERVIELLVKERTRGRNIAYHFRDAMGERANSLEKAAKSIDKPTFNDKLVKKYTDIANECRQIGNAISGSNALTGDESIEDRIRKEYEKELSNE